MTAIRWGILATGWIAEKLAEALAEVEGAETLAVGSRTQEAAEAFGARWAIPRRYGSYEALAADPDLDVIFIATPHSHHAANMRLCLEAGKHVLCEKPLTLNAAEAAECIHLARRQGLFLMEAMWMRYVPAIAQVRQWVDEGVIGRVRLVQADFCINIPYRPTHRLYDPALGGGALLDLGIYPLSLSAMLLGLPEQIEGQAVLSPTGVDELDAITLRYADGALAQLSCSSRLKRPIEAFVVGDQGYIKIHDPLNHPERLTLQRAGRPPQIFDVPHKGNGYVHEVEEVQACLRAGRRESALMPLDESLALMRLMDELRADWGVRYPAD